MRILIADDERDIADSLREFFEDEGYCVATAANGAEALARLAEEEPPGVVLLDLIMPIVNGNEVYRAMQEDPRLREIPVIVSTSDPSRAPSGVLIMRKPIDLQRLLGAVRQYARADGAAG